MRYSHRCKFLVNPKEGVFCEVLRWWDLSREGQDLSFHLWKCYQGLWTKKILLYFTIFHSDYISFDNLLIYYTVTNSLSLSGCARVCVCSDLPNIHMTHPQCPSQLWIWKFSRKTEIIEGDLIMYSLVPGKHDSHLEGRYVQVEPSHIIAEGDLWTILHFE